MEHKKYYLGIDIGSTTVKLALIETDSFKLIYHKYVRHNAEQAVCVENLLSEIHELYPDANLIPSVCGSGGFEIAQVLRTHYIQEVVATGLVVKHFYPRVKTAIELGGQDAKLIFFEQDTASGNTIVSDMRMNGSCAGGTGAFIDQVAELLNLSSEEFGSFAEKAKQTYEISGRCGVFAKTDIQPLLNRGVPREDIALSTFHAIVKQTIGGLAQGLEIKGPAIFIGGPLTFNPSLISVFKERLELNTSEVIIPDHPETLVAHGAALSIYEMFSDLPNHYSPKSSLKALREYIKNGSRNKGLSSEKFFSSEEEKKEFHTKHALPEFISYLKTYKIKPKTNGHPDKVLGVYLGIDAGSTTSKFVLIDKDENLVDKFYSNNEGEPLSIIKKGLVEIYHKYKKHGIELKVLGAGSTGYGEQLFAKAFKLDYHIVETVAHTKAAVREHKDVSFILDIGGQDMKAIYVDNGIPVNFVLNEACSAGCGSFLETYASAMNIKTFDIAKIAFEADSPSQLGSRCTVFMNSSIITEQKNGRPVSDIFAGLCNSVIENALTKVLRVPSFDAFGDNIVVQGGTFKNDAVFRAFQLKTGKNIIRPAHPGEMGAIGVALLTKEHIEDEAKDSTFSWSDIEIFESEKLPASICEFCSNNCTRTIIQFTGGDKFITGNRCEKGEILDNEGGVQVKQLLKKVSKKMRSVPDLYSYRERLLTKDFEFKKISKDKNITIGIPRVLDFWDSLPFWKTFFKSLGYKVILSPPSSYKIFENGLGSVSSDTICLPAKLSHGHIKELIKEKPDRIFNPMMIKTPLENESSMNSWMCPIIQAYSEVVKIHDEPEVKHGIKYDAPPFQWENIKVRNKQTVKFAKEKLGLKKKFVLQAIEQADIVRNTFRENLVNKGQELLDKIEEGKFVIVLAGRPYHNDSFINHDLSSHFTNLGIPVMDLDSLPGIHDVDVSKLLVETNNIFHTRLLAASLMAAENSKLELVQVVSFGCGHDAVLSDELIKLMKEKSGKIPLVLKLDEGENVGPVGIRVKSFIETIKNKRHHSAAKKIMPELIK